MEKPKLQDSTIFQRIYTNVGTIEERNALTIVKAIKILITALVGKETKYSATIKTTLQKTTLAIKLFF
jgi:hypothetical protein